MAVAKKSRKGMKPELFEKLVQAMEDAVAYSRGEHVEGLVVHHFPAPERIDVKALRQRLGMSREVFAATFAFKLSTVAKWERGLQTPRGVKKVLLRIIEREPDAVIRALTLGGSGQSFPKAASSPDS